MEFLASRDYRVGLEVIDSVSGEHLLVRPNSKKFGMGLFPARAIAGRRVNTKRGRICWRRSHIETQRRS
jgi:hypothetical protein